MCFIEEETPLVKRKTSVISSLGKVLAGALFVIGVVIVWEQAEALYSQYASETAVGIEESPLIAESSLGNFLPKASVATEAMLSESQEKVGRALDLIIEGEETAELDEEAVGTEKLSIPTVMMLNLKSRRFFTDETTKSTVKVTKEKMEQSLSKLLDEEKIKFRLKLQGVKMATPDALKKRVFPGGYLGGTAAPSTIAFVKSNNSPNCAKYDTEPTFTMKGAESQKATFNLKDFGPLNDERQYVPIELMYAYSDIYSGDNIDPEPRESEDAQFPKQGEDTSSENLADKIRPEGDETQSRQFRNAYGQTARIFQFMKVPHGDAPGEVKCLVDTWSSGRWKQVELGPCFQKKTKGSSTVLVPTPNSKWVVIPTETCTQDCGSQVGKYITNAFNLAGAATMFLISGVAFATPLGWPIIGLEMGLGAAGLGAALLPEVALWGTAAAELTAPTWGILEVCTLGIIAVDEVGTLDSVSGQKSIADTVDDAINTWLYPDECTQLDTIFAQGAIDQTIKYSSGGSKFKDGTLLGFIDCPPEYTAHVCFSFEKDQILGNGRIWENKAKTRSTGRPCDVKAKNPKADKKKAKKEELNCRQPGLCRISVACPRSCGSGSKLLSGWDITKKKCECTTINNLGPKIHKLSGYKSKTKELKWVTEDPRPTGEKMLMDEGWSKEDAKLGYAQTCTKNGALEKSYFIAFEDWYVSKGKSVIRPVHLLDVETELGTPEMEFIPGLDPGMLPSEQLEGEL